MTGSKERLWKIILLGYHIIRLTESLADSIWRQVNTPSVSKCKMFFYIEIN